jgi:hypothetical protein
MSRHRLISTKVAGPSHIARGEGCQDFVITRAIGQSFVMVACDGAGSAPKSAIGANTVSDVISSIFLDIARELESRNPGEWLVDEIVQAIVQARAEVRKVGGRNSSISEFHTTLVAIVCHSTGGFICHIGDGWGVAITDNAGKISTTVSAPRNGEYANETFFVTEASWIKNLQVTPFSGAPLVVSVMTDGAGSIFQARQDFDFQRFLDFVTNFSETEEEVLAFIGSTDAEKLSGDDKSIALFVDKIRASKIQAAELGPMVSILGAPVAATTPTSPGSPDSASVSLKPNTKTSRKARFGFKRTLLYLGAFFIIVLIALIAVFVFLIQSSGKATPQATPAPVPAASTTSPPGETMSPTEAEQPAKGASVQPPPPEKTSPGRKVTGEGTASPSGNAGK